MIITRALRALRAVRVVNQAAVRGTQVVWIDLQKGEVHLNDYRLDLHGRSSGGYYTVKI